MNFPRFLVAFFATVALVCSSGCDLSSADVDGDGMVTQADAYAALSNWLADFECPPLENEDPTMEPSDPTTEPGEPIDAN